MYFFNNFLDQENMQLYNEYQKIHSKEEFTCAEA